MIEAAEAEGRIEPGRTTIVEATSGNTGIALAFVCAAKGYDLVLTLPQGMSREREALLRLYGARVDITESMGGMGEAVAAAQAMARDGDVFLPDQFSNPANPEAHRRTTGPEIARALEDRVDVLVAGVGTGGTITGVGEYLREQVNPALRVIAVEPAGSAVLSGGEAGPHRIQGIGAGFVPPVLNRELIDEVIPISDDDAIQTAWRCAKRGRPARGDLLRGGAPRRPRPRPAPRGRGQADRRDDARLRVSATSRRPSSRPERRRPMPEGGCGRKIPATLLSCPVSERSLGWPKRSGATSSQHRDRDPSARGVSRFEILATWPGIHALLGYRVRTRPLPRRTCPSCRG